MFKNLKFSYKIFVIPALATLTFIILLIMTQSFTRKNESLLNETVSGHIPALQFSRDLLEMLASIQRSLQDAVTSEDEDELSVADGFRDQFLQRIEAELENPVLESDELDQLKKNFLDYYVFSRNTTDRMIQDGTARNMNDTLERMTTLYNSFKEKLESNIQRDNKNMKFGFTLTRTNNRIMMVVSSVTILISILLLSGLSLFIIRSITRPLGVAINVAEKVARGELTVDIDAGDARDEAGILIQSFSRMVENLRRLMGQIKEGANSVAAAAGQISTSVTEIASSATETASAASETSTTVEEVRQTALDSNNKAKNVSDSSQKAVDVSQTGEKSVTETVEGMHRIEAQMESIAESIMKLSEHGQAIGEIIATVEDVAEQSGLLAVNASIEAVKAGEQGKGFSVVAQEVRSLAEQSKQATARVRNILDDIQKATSEAVMKTEQGSKAVDEGVKQSAESGEAIQRLANSVADAAQATTQIAVSSQEQLVGMDQVVSAMESIKQASDQNVAATKQVESAAQDLHSLGQKLKQLVEQYSL